MDSKNINNSFKVVLSVGDESGIGPEIILKALCSDEIPENIDFILVGSKKNLNITYTNLRNLGLENLANPNNLEIHEALLKENPVLHRPSVRSVRARSARISIISLK